MQRSRSITFCRFTTFVATTLLVASTWLLSATTLPPAQPPNIIYMLLDDLGVEELAPYGGRLVQTPNLNRLATEGLRFTNHYAGTSVCAPSRCALMTGLHTGHCEVRGNKQMEPHGQMPLSEGAVTVAHVLKRAGYQTALIGKWGLGIEGPTGEPTRQGFDSYYGYLDQVLAHNNFPAYLLRKGPGHVSQRESLPNHVVWEPKTALFRGLGSFTPSPVVYSNDLFTDEALRFLAQPRSRPFFLYLSYTLPHNNGEAPPGQQFQAPTLAPYEHENWPELDKHYAATLTRLDQYVGRLMQALRERGLAGNTLVLFSSDNGSTEDIPARFAAHNQLRGVKRSPYEGGIRAPLLAWWPGRVRPGVSHVLTAQWDFLATAAELAGAPAPATDGRSLRPVLLGEAYKAADWAARPMYWEFHERNSWQAVRQGTHKLVRWTKTDAYELYDLATDPGEQTNLARQRPARVAALQTVMQQQHRPSAEFPF